MMSLPIKLCLKYFTGMTMSMTEESMKIALVALWSEKLGVYTSSILSEKRVGVTTGAVPRNFAVYIFFDTDFEKLKL